VVHQWGTSVSKLLIEATGDLLLLWRFRGESVTEERSGSIWQRWLLLGVTHVSWLVEQWHYKRVMKSTGEAVVNVDEGAVNLKNGKRKPFIAPNFPRSKWIRIMGLCLLLPNWESESLNQ
jgi:hypothetical protein